MGQKQAKQVDAESPECTFLLDWGSGDDERQDPSHDPNGNPNFPLHLAAYSGELERVEELLNNGIDNHSVSESLTRWLDDNTRSPLHYATHPTSSRDLKVIQLLLKRDKEDPVSEGKPPFANLQDVFKKTALHYAATSEEPQVVSLLLEFGADPNLKDNEDSTPLHILAGSNSDSAVECAKLILDFPNFSHPSEFDSGSLGASGWENTVVCHAIKSNSPKMLRLFVERGFDIASPDHDGITPLMLTSYKDSDPEEEILECVMILTDAYSAKQVNAKEKTEEKTALHMAASQAHATVLKGLLSSNKTDVFAKDSFNLTALHHLLIAGARGRNKVLQCVKLICECKQTKDKDRVVEFIFGPHKPKKESGFLYPIQLAARTRQTNVIEYLLAAHPNKDQWMGDDKLMNDIYTIVPCALVPTMNQSLKYDNHEFNLLHADFRIIAGAKDPIKRRAQETKYLNLINKAPKAERKKILLHPLVQIFLDRKWDRIRQLTWIYIFVQLSWIVSYTLMVYEMYVPNCNNIKGGNQTGTAEENGSGGEGEKGKGHMRILTSLVFLYWEDDCRFHQVEVRCTAVVLYVLSALILVEECFQLWIKKKYFGEFINWIQLGILLAAVVNSIPAWQLSSASQLSPWQTNLAAVGIFVAWVMALRELGKFPKCGVYSAILREVCWHCLKMLLVYSPLLIGFAMCFRILTPGNGQYNYLLYSLIKVVVMMTGELDFENAFYGDDTTSGGPSLASSDIFGQIMFLLLVFVTTIVLLNLLTALAVSDVTQLLEEADLHRLSLQLDRMHLVEALILSARNKMAWLNNRRNLLYRWNATSGILWDKTNYEYAAEHLVPIGDYNEELHAKIREVIFAAEE